MSDENVATPAEPATPAPAAPETPKDTPKPVSSDALYQEKIDALHKDLSKERQEKKALKAQLDEISGKVNLFELKEKKSAALDMALHAIGEDFEIPVERQVKLKSTIERLQDGETLAEAIADAVELAKVPKQKQKFGSPFTPGMPPSAGSNRPQWQPGQKLTPIEAGQLPPDEFESYIRSLRGGRS